MFKSELKVATNMFNLADTVTNAASNLADNLLDIETFVSFLHNEGMLEGDNADYMFDNVVTSERQAAKELVLFDKLLNRLIAERMKLGNFEITVSR